MEKMNELRMKASVSLTTTYHIKLKRVYTTKKTNPKPKLQKNPKSKQTKPKPKIPKEKIEGNMFKQLR